MTKTKRMPTEYQETGFWQSYSDMMAGLLLVFILIVCGTLVILMQVKISYDESELALEERQSQLEEEISQKYAFMSLSEEQQALLEAQQARLDEQQARLDEQQAQLDEQQATLDVQQNALTVQQALLAAQQTEIETQQAALDSQQHQLEEIIGVKKQIITALSEEFSGSDLNISIDESTGAITFDSTILFDYDASDLISGGKTTLREFLPRYFAVVLSDEYRSYVSEIIFEGHTDTSGSYLYNLELSQSRAEAVASYCLDPDNGLFTEDEIEEIRAIATVSGRSWSDPIYNNDGSVDADASRRVEIKFRLSDEEMISEMLKVLEQYEN